jgi:hypothetical protein
VSDRYFAGLIVQILLWGVAADQIVPIYLSLKIYFAFPRVKDWSQSWVVFIVAMFSIGFRRALVAGYYDPSCHAETEISWIFDQIVMTLLHSLFFSYFVILKDRFFLHWFEGKK